MALFKILKGPEKKDALGNSVMLSGTNGAPPLHEGWAYVTDEGNLYVDLSSTKRVKINQNADYAIVAEYDIKNQPIISTYIKNAALNTSATQPTYTFTRGDNTTFSVNTPIASATLAGIITTGSQTLTGSKTLDAKGSLTIQKSNGFTYTGIESENGNSYRPVWFARSDKNGTPVYNANFTYNPNTATLKVANLDGLAAKATADGNGDNIRSTYVKNLGLTTNKYGITYQKGDGTETTISPNLAASDSNGGTALTAAQLVSYDTRGINPTPQDLAKGIHLDFKTNTTDNLKDGGSYHGTMSWRSYGSSTDLSGGYPIEIAYTANGNLWTRMGTSATEWGSWKRLVYSDGTIANATKATQDGSGQVITATYIKNMALVNSATQPAYTLTRGDNTTFSVNVPIASATNAGNITTGTQTITGAKTIDANGSLTIAKGSGFIYSGIETAGDTTDGDRQVWVAHGSTKGIPVLSGANFTYNSKTKTLKVSHIIGEITKAISDTLNQQIDKTYIKNITLTGHATQPYLVLTKGDNTTSNLNLPIASTTAAGLITNTAQTIAGDKTFTGQILKKGVSSSWIGGRTNALVRMTEIHGYSPFASIKTTNGSWEIGAYDNSSYTDDLVFSYCTDANFNAGSNSTTAQIKFLENGHIVAALDGRATQALQDSQGQQINTTYLKGIVLVNHATLPKYTITKGDGNTFDVNLPVANESNAGVITNTTQALAGNKSLKGSLSTTENITTAKQLISNIATGTSPLKVTSTTVVTNLNADTVDGMHASNNSFTQANASNTTLPTQLAIWNSLNSLLISAQALVYRGTLTPAQFKALSASGVNRGDVFVVSAEGSFGGKYCEPGDMLICYDKTSTAVTWDIVQTNIDGSVVIKGGGAAATVHADVHAIARFDSNTGRVIDNSKVFIDDNGHITASVTDTQDIGTADNVWRNIYATNFEGLASKATADASGQDIMNTYIKNITLETKQNTTNVPQYEFTRGNNNTVRVDLPVASTTYNGIITTDTQTITGAKIINTNGSLTIQKSNGFIYSGISTANNSTDKDLQIWIAHANTTGIPICSGAGLTYNPKTQTLKVANIIGTISKATGDGNGDNIRSTYVKSLSIDSTGHGIVYTKGDNTENTIYPLFAGAATNGGAALSANKLTTARNITVGAKTNSFNGTANIAFSKYDIDIFPQKILDTVINNDPDMVVTDADDTNPLVDGKTLLIRITQTPASVSPIHLNYNNTGNKTVKNNIGTDLTYYHARANYILLIRYNSDMDIWQCISHPMNNWPLAVRNSTTNGKYFFTGVSSTGNVNVNTLYKNSAVYFNPSTGIITASGFNGNASSASRLQENSSTVSSDPGGLTWFNINGTAGCTADVNDTPTTAWWYILRNRHTNTSNNYYTDIAIPFNDTNIYYKIVRNGSVVNNAWIKVLDTNNYTGTLDGRYVLKTSTAPANLNSATTSGFYRVNNGHSNSPGSWGQLIVCHGGGDTITQIYGDFNSGTLYTRSGNSSDVGGSGSWHGWYRLWKQGDAVTGAVWNDYAECRESDIKEAGYVLSETGKDNLIKTTKRLQHFAGVSSDTWGFSQGETKKAKTPIAVAGRVLVYPYRDRSEYKPGDCVCAAPGGTVDIMTREEVIQYPDRIVGTVSCVPDYEEWGGGELADRDPIKVNGRIWIKVR